MAKKSLPDVRFPFGGIVETTSYADQPPGTCSDALNVRPYDSLKARKRGGQRSGQEKYFTSAVDGSNPIQRMDYITLAFDSNLVVADTVLSPDPNDTTKTDIWSYSDGKLETVSSSRWTTYENSTAGNKNFLYGTAVNDANSVEVDDNDLTGSPISQAFIDYHGATLTTKASLATSYVLKYELEFPQNTTAGHDIFALMSWRMLDDPSNPGDLNRFSGYTFELKRNAGAGTVNIDALLNKTIPGVGTSAEQTDLAIETTSAALYTATVEIIVSGDSLTIRVNDAVIVSAYNMDSLSTQNNTGIVFNRSAAVGGTLIPARCSELTYFNGLLPASRRTTKLVVVSGGSVYSGTAGGGLSAATNGSAIFNSSNEVWSEDAFQNVYLSDGVLYRVLDPALNIISNWQTSLTAGSLPVGGSGVLYTITAVNTATPSFTVAEDVSTELSAGDFIEVLGSTGNDQTYTVASTSGTGPTIITTDQSIPDSTADGTLAKGNVTCRFMALYRGRVVLSGLETDPHNWFMSKAEDPLNFDYYPATTSETDAVAGNTNQAGKLEDIVTALMPYLDDVLYIGGDHTIWKLSGDPAAETGRFDNVSRQIGVMGPEAWTYDSIGNLYFLGQNGLYRVQAGSLQLEQVGPGKLDDTFQNLDFAANRVRLLYDREWRGVQIFVTPVAAGLTSTDNYFWDERTDSFWIDNYPIDHGPTAVLLFDADQFDDRAVLLGGRDSIIRTFSRTAKDDDGTLISSHVLFTPLIAGDRSRLGLTELTVNLAEGSDSNAVVEVFAAETAEDAASETTPKAAKALSEGRNNPLVKRVSGNAIQVKVKDITATSTWALESGSAGVNLKGIVRREETK